MDNSLPQVQQETNQLVPEQPVQPPLNNSTSSLKRILLIVTAIVLLLAIVGGAYLFGTKNNNSKNVRQITPTATPTSTSNPTVNWKTYINTKYGYSLKYPPKYEAEQGGTLVNAKSDEASFTVDLSQTALDVSGTAGGGGFPFFYINVVSTSGSPTNLTYNNDGFTQHISEYLSSNIGSTIAPPNQPWNATFVRQNDMTINGNTYEVFQQSSFTGDIDRRLVIEHNGFIYIIGTYYSGQPDATLNLFQSILSTLKFTN